MTPHALRHRALLAFPLLTLSLAACGGGNTPHPNNELPFGFVDTPKAESVLPAGPTVIGGWALDDSAISEIRVYFDGRYKASTTLTVPRPDVAAAMPKYGRPGAMHGWNVRVDFGKTPGPHAILVQAVDDQGATRDIGVVSVTGR